MKFQRFGEIYCLHLQGRRETFYVRTYQTTHCEPRRSPNQFKLQFLQSCFTQFTMNLLERMTQQNIERLGYTMKLLSKSQLVTKHFL